MDIRSWMLGSTKKPSSSRQAVSTSQSPPTNTDSVKNSNSSSSPKGNEERSRKRTVEETFSSGSTQIQPKPERKRLKSNKIVSLDDSDEDGSGIDKKLTSSVDHSTQKTSDLEKDSKQDFAVKEKKSPTPLKKIQSVERILEMSGKLFDGMKIAVTGVFLDFAREEIEELILQNGGKVASSISGKTTFLIAGRILEDGRQVNEGNKYKTALERGVSILTEEEFFRKYNPKAVRGNVSHPSSSLTEREPTMDKRLWVDKYKPKAAADLIGHGEIVRKLMDWLRTWSDVHLRKKIKPSYTKENPGARAVLLSGPPGIGKTSLAMLVAGLMKFDVLELNASDTRNKAEIDQILIEAVSSKAISNQAFFNQNRQQSNDSALITNRVIVMDEVDGMGGSDRGGIAELIKIIKISKIPIICICNDRQSPKVKGLANNCFDLRVKRPTKGHIAQRLVQISTLEGFQVDLNAAEMLVEQSGNDIRQALNALQMWSISGKHQMNYQDMKDGIHRIEKDKVLRQSPFDACLTILSGGKQGSFEERYNSFFIDYSLVPLLIQQNYIDSSKSGIFRNPQFDDVKKMELLSLAADAVSDIDMVGSRIRGLDQHWELLPTQAIFSVKAGYHVQGFQAFPSFPAWLGKYSSTAKRQRLTKDIVHHTCLSIGQGFLPIRLDYISFLRNALLFPLLKLGKEGISKTVELLDHYDLSKEDFMDSFREMQFHLENDKILFDQYEALDSQTKTALTKYYNSVSHKSATIVQSIGVKKSRRTTSSEDDFINEDGEIIADENILNEEGPEEEEDIEALRAQMNKSLNKSKPKKQTKEKGEKALVASSKTKKKN